MELKTQRLVLRELEERDAPACHRYERLPEVVRFQTHGPRTLEESLEAIRRVREQTASDSPRRLFELAVTLGSTGALIGRVGMRVTSWEQQEAMLWYVIAPEHQGHGDATEAARAVLGLAFDTLGLHRVFADVDPRNSPSIRTAERLGLRREAHFRENFLCKGEWTDSVILALLDREWRARP